MKRPVCHGANLAVTNRLRVALRGARSLERDQLIELALEQQSVRQTVPARQVDFVDSGGCDLRAYMAPMVTGHSAKS